MGNKLLIVVFKFLQRCRSYGTEEVFEVINVSAQEPVRLGNRTYWA